MFLIDLSLTLAYKHGLVGVEKCDFLKLPYSFLHIYAAIPLFRIIFLQGPFGFFEMQFVLARIQQLASLF